MSCNVAFSIAATQFILSRTLSTFGYGYEVSAGGVFPKCHSTRRPLGVSFNLWLPAPHTAFNGPISESSHMHKSSCVRLLRCCALSPNIRTIISSSHFHSSLPINIAAICAVYVMQYTYYYWASSVCVHAGIQATANMTQRTT